MNGQRDDKASETTVFLPLTVTVTTGAPSHKQPAIVVTDDEDLVRKRTAAKLDIPIGAKALKAIDAGCCKASPGVGWWKFYMLFITYLFYVAYHISRRPLGVVKNVLHQKSCPNISMSDPRFDPERNATWCMWEPFDQKNYHEMYAGLDFTYWIMYAIGMFFVGHVAERSNLRKFLTCGMLAAGAGTMMFGLAYFWNIHSFWYFLGIQAFTGVFQSTGFPSVVALVSNWFGKTRIGFIFGVWGSHGPVGNILGALLAGVWVKSNWGLSFIVPGAVIAIGGICAFLFVIVKPEDAGFPPADHGQAPTPAKSVEDPDGSDVVAPKQAISILGAIKIPGVMEFAIAFFFGKSVAYMFLVWTPTLVKEIGAVDATIAAYISVVFDIGGIAGGILAGFLSDYTKKPATICAVMFLLGAIVLFLTMTYGGVYVGALMTFLVIAGICINGPSSLITTAVASDLGTRPSLVGNTKAIATVIAVINGTGSLGAAFGPMIAQLLEKHGWRWVFWFLIASQLVALTCISRLTFKEIRAAFAKRNKSRNGIN